MPADQLELDDGVDLDPVCPVCHDTGVVVVRVQERRLPDIFIQAHEEQQECPCRWER